MTSVHGDFAPSELVVVRAADAQALSRTAGEIAFFLEQAPSAPLKDVAFTCSKTEGSCVLALVTQSVEDLRARLALAAARIAAGVGKIKDKSGTYYNAVPGEGKLAFVFPGGFSYYPDMLHDVAILFGECRSAFDELEEALSGTGSFSPASFVFPPAAYYCRDADVFSAGGYAEALVSVYSAGVALIRLFDACGVRPEGLTGFAGGDLAAIAHSGALGEFKRSKRLEFLKDMYLLSRKTVTGMPAPSGLTLDLEWCRKYASYFRKFAKAWVTKSPSVPVYSCITASPISQKPRIAREEAAAIWTEQIRFEDTVRRMHADGYRTFVEVGPRSVLSSVIRDVLRGNDFTAVSSNTIHRPGLVQFQHALAQLAANGHPVDPSPLFQGRRPRELDFSSPLSIEVKADSEMRLSREFPRLTMPSDPVGLSGIKVQPGPATPGARAKVRAAAAAARARKQRQLDFGTLMPLVSDAETVREKPGEMVEIVKTFTVEDCPFLADFAFGTSQISYSDRKLRGFTPLSLPVAAEIMAEVAARLVPNRHLVAVDDLQSARTVEFRDGRLRISAFAERVASGDPCKASVKVTLKEDGRDTSVTAPVCMATFSFAESAPEAEAFVPSEMNRPRSVHWTDREIYPQMLDSGESLQCIRKADIWSEEGLDYEIEVPRLEGAVSFTRLPQWELNPRLLSVIADGFALWRSHRRFAGAFSIAFRLRHLTVNASSFPEGARLRCYLRLSGVTPKSQIADIRVSDGNGKQVLSLEGYEELIERVPEEYCRLILSPATACLTQPLAEELVGSPATSVATAWVSDVSYPIFERNSELWLKTMSQIVLCEGERRAFREMPGSPQRRTEWLFGRIAAKEAVRRFLHDNYQARWSSADIQIWADDQGKPHALGAWADFLSSRIDLAITHTRDFVAAAAASNARVGIDAEYSTRDLTEEFTKGVFTPEEMEIAAGSSDGPVSLIRFWCAKEAVSKALGTGIRYSPREMVVSDYLPASGVLTMRLEGAWAEAFKNLKGRGIPVSVGTMRDHALAFCFIPASLFENA
jgi:phosphopantetheinyl transferase (holo-ACP synthase)/malonyl CoA-acyl carrier protein transacylase